MTFAGTPVGDLVQSFTTEFTRLTGIEERQNFWAPTVLLDGGYPAQKWTHEITIYKEEPTRRAFMEFLFGLEGLILPAPATLTLVSSVTTPTAFTTTSYGACYLDSASLDDPRELLLFEAGFFVLRFLGTVRPTVTP